MAGLGGVYEKMHVQLPQSPPWARGPVYHRLRTYGSTRARSARLPVIIAAFIAAGIMFVLFTGVCPPDAVSQAIADLSLKTRPDTPSALSPSRPGSVHLLVPASNPDENLCKALVSSSILGYPSPKVLNWGKTFNDERLVSGGSHIAKISGVFQYLESLLPEQDDDLVLMVDGYDVWFQLRPQTLIQRYFDINRRANDRIRRDLGDRVVNKNKIEQKIVFSAQKRCWPWAPDAAPCYAVPNSTLPHNVFGPDTDTDVGDRNPYLKFRPRYLNSGVAIGTAGAMRLLFAEALARARADANFGSDQNIFGAIFGEQEVYREVLRQRGMSRSERLSAHIHGDPRAGLIHETDLAAMRKVGRSMEFGIGLDYEGAISLPTVFSEDDTEWVTFNDQPSIDAFNSARNIAPDANNLLLHVDIAATPSPLKSNGSDGLPNKRWSQVPLFTDVPTGYTPAVIHHNAHRDGMKALRRTAWDKVWFQPYARALMDAYMDAPAAQTLAVAGGREWRSSDEWKGGAREDVGEWLAYQDLCAGTEDEVFRDGKGGWEADAHV